MNVSRQWSWFRALKWGRSNPGACLWFVASPLGQYVIVAEYKFKQEDVTDVIAEIRKIDVSLRMAQPARYCCAEPILWKIDEEGAPTLAESFAVAGFPLIKSSGERIQGWNQLSALMKKKVCDPNTPEVLLPALVVSSKCSELARLIPTLAEGSGTGVDAKEDIDKKGDVVLAEALRIGAMSRPQPTHVAGVTPDSSMMGHALERARRESRQNSNARVII